ncbi:MAG: prepilin-type N-terminal cleavage/methylation domain-containing protein [Pseudomonadota bacterium]
MKQRQAGFTLMEMIGVVAVIAILASMATPMIFDAIRNARITAFVEDVNVMRTAVARFYEDTGDFPDHEPTSSNAGNHQLLSDNPSSPIAGWNGPYIEAELGNPFNEDGFRRIQVETGADYQFDLDGDGTVDTSSAVVLRVDGVSDTEARRVSDILDGDADVTTGNGAWNAAGRVKRYGANSDHASIMLVYIAQD